VATDVGNQREIWIKSGKLFDAIRASISIPLLFTPFRKRGIDLIDGGVLNPVPVAPTIGDETDITIAVNLAGAEESPENPESAGPSPAVHPSPLHEKINRFINRLQRSAAASGRDWGAYDIAMQAFEAMQSSIARQKLAAYPPDIVIEIPRNACQTLEFDRAAEMIEMGYQKTGECLAQAGRIRRM